MDYKMAGVDVEAGRREVELLKEITKKTHSSAVLNSIGGFAALYRPEFKAYKDPILVSGTDGVGTKILIAQKLKRYDTIGIDCVAMCVNDICAMGAKPLFFLDYIATGKLIPEEMAKIVESVAKGCEISNAALIGGETAEMPGLYQKDEFDIAGFCVGIVDRDEIIDREKVKSGDKIYAISSSGIHSNGYSLVRKIIEEKNLDLDLKYGLGIKLSDALLEPTRIYAKEIEILMRDYEIHGLAHNTGGGVYENLPRAIPEGLSAKLNLKDYKIPKIFKFLMEYGEVSYTDMFATFNMGMGMFVITDQKIDKKLMDQFQIFEVGVIIEGRDVEIEF